MAYRSSDAFSGKISATLVGNDSNYLFFFMKRSINITNLFLIFSMKALEVHSLKLSANLRKHILSLLIASVNATLELKTPFRSLFISCCIFFNVIG